MFYFGSAAQEALSRHAKQPKFKGRRSDWVSFRWDWDNYVRLIGGRNLVHDEQLLTLLSLCLEDSFQWNVNRRLRSGELVTFNQFWAELEAEFGPGGIGSH